MKRPPVELSENSLAVLERRYLRRGLDGKPKESVTEMFERVATHVAAAEEEWQGNVELVVEDSGIGIDPEEHNLIFEQFYVTGDVQLHSTSKTSFKGGGLGLGLAIAKGVVEAHGGKIWVESKGRDEVAMPGSQFHVLLPLDQSLVLSRTETELQVPQTNQVEELS